MRTALRLSLLAGVALAGVTCTESPTAPRTTLATVAIAPSFSRDAVQAWQSLAAFNMAANNVRVVLRRPGPPEVILKDTVVAFAPGQSVFSIELTVAVNSPNEQLGANVQFRDGDAVLFEGSSSVTAVPVIGGTTGGTGGSGSVEIPIQYVGPGASATKISISPRDQVIATGAQVSFSVSATDANGQVRTPPQVLWSLSDATIGQVDANTGLFVAANKRGTTRVRAKTVNGLADSVSVTVVPPPQRLVVISGGGQTTVAGRALAQPMVVELQATDGLPIQGATIAFAASEGASVSPSTATTDANGRASATMTLSRTVGSNTFTAAAAGVSAATVTATGTQPPASAIAVVSGDAQSGAVGTAAAQPLVIRVTDEFGAPVGGATVSWSVVSGGGSLSGTSTTTGSDGLSQVTYTYGKQPGSASVRAAVSTPTGSAAASFALTARSGTVATLSVVSGQSQGGAPRTVLQPFVVKALDALGNPVAGVTIAWSGTASAGTLSATQSTTAADGTASTTLTLGTTAGQVTITASTGGGAITANFDATIQTGAPAILSKAAGDAQSAPVGTAVATAPSVKVTDTYGNALSGVAVTFAVASGGGSITGASATTNGSGIATVGSWTLGATAGSNTLTATSGSLSATFTATGVVQSTAPSITNLVVSPTTIAIGGSAQYTATLVNNTGAPISSTILQGYIEQGTSRFAAGGTTVGCNGMAQPDGIVPVGSSCNVSFVVSVTTSPAAGAANFALELVQGSTTLATARAAVTLTSTATSIAYDPTASGNNQTGTVGTALANPVKVVVQDAAGHAVSGATVTFTLSGTGSINGVAAPNPVTVTTDANGNAAATWTLGTTAGTQSLQAAIASVTPIVFSATAVAAAPAKLGFLAQPSANIVSTSADQVQVEVRDAYNNRVTTASDSITLAIASGTGTSGAGVYGPPGPPTIPGARASAGVAVISYGIDKAGTGYQLDASSVTTPALTVARSTAFNVAVGPAKHATVFGSNAFSGTAGNTLSTPLVAQITDAGGNPVPSGVSVTFKVQSGGGSLDANGVLGTTVPASTDANGRASVSWILGTSGSQGVVAYIDDGSGNAAGTMAQYTATIVAAAAQMAVVSQPPATTASQSLFPSPIVVQLRDSTGASLAAAGVPVTMSVNVLPAFKTAARVASPKHGRERRAGAPGSSTGTVAPRSGSGVLGAVAASSGTASLMCPTCGTTAFIGSGAPGGNATTVTVNTDANGQASFSSVGVAGWTGTYRLTFTSGTMPSAYSSSFSLTAGPAVTLMTSYDSTFDAGGQLLQDFPTAIVIDSVTNGVEGIPVSIAVTSGGGMVDTTMRSSGPWGNVDISDWRLGAVSGLGPTLNEVKVTASSLPNSPFVTLRAYAMQPKKLDVYTTETPFPTSVVSGTSLNGFMIQVYDSAGAAGGHYMNKTGMTVAVKLLNASGMTLTGVLSDTTDQWGSVYFSNLILTGSGTAQLAFYGNDGAVPLDTLYKTVNVTAAPAGIQTIGANWLLTQVHGSASTPPTSFGVTVKDEAGTPLGGVGVDFSLSDEGGACTFAGDASTATVTTDGSGNALPPLTLSGAVGSCVIHVSVPSGGLTAELRSYSVPPAGAGGYKVWLGNGASGAWDDGNNWIDAGTNMTGAPGATDRVFISMAGASQMQPYIPLSTTVGKLWITPTASLDVGTLQLTVSDSLNGGGFITGQSGSSVLLTGSSQAVDVTAGSTVKMIFGSTGCSGGSITLVGNVNAGSADVNCPVDLNGHVLGVSGNFATIGSGAISSSNTGSILSLQGNATFGGATGSMTEGMINLGSDLTVSSPSSFIVGANVSLYTNGSAAQAFNFPSSAGSSIGKMYINNTTGVQLAGQVAIPTELYIYGGSSGSTSKLTIATGASVNAATRTDVYDYGLLTVNGALNTPILSVAATGSVVANGTITGVTTCTAGAGAVTGTGKPATCP